MSSDPAERLEELLAEHREPEPGGDGERAAADADAEMDPFAPLPDALEAGATQEAEDEQARETLPDAPLFALLRTVEEEIGVDRIDRIWVFPPRRLQVGETAVVVVAVFPETGPDDRRRVYAAHYTAHQDAQEPRLALDEYGTAPTERVGRLVEEVVERLKEGPSGAPRSHRVERDADRWSAILYELAEAYLSEIEKNPRLRR